MYYSWNTVTATYSGSVKREVQCESCLETYSFVIEREVSASRHSPYGLLDPSAAERAKKAAKKKLEQLLANEIVAIPCPNCGWIQRDMFPALQKRQRSWRHTSMIFAFALSSGSVLLGIMLADQKVGQEKLGFPGFAIGGAGALFFGICGLILYGYQRLWQRTYNPNEQIPLEKRLARGRRLAHLVGEEPSPEPPPPTAPPPWQRGARGSKRKPPEDEPFD